MSAPIKPPIDDIKRIVYPIFDIQFSDLFGRVILKAESSGQTPDEAKTFLKSRIGRKLKDATTTLTRQTGKYSHNKGDVKILITTVYIPDRFKAYYEKEV